MEENKIFEALLDVIPFAAYAVDINTYELVYANKLMSENLYAPREEFCWKKVFGQEEVCSWCSIAELKQRERLYKSEKLIGSFFDEARDRWFQTYDELVRWPDGRTVKYSISVDITEQKEIQASMIQTHTKLAMQSKKLKEVNEQLEYLAKKDSLTGINNRGNFFILGEQHCLKNRDKTIFVAMLDIDKFKSINDTYGHKTGDLALKAFTAVVEEHLIKPDIFGRLGGEEFALIMTTDSHDEASNRVEGIRKDIEKVLIKHNDVDVSFTVSIGMVKKDSKETLDMALERADRELYDAKDSGRNRLKFRL